MNVTMWGTRGSVAAPGPETARYGGNTSCVQVVGQQGTILVLDAGTGLRRLGMALPGKNRLVHILLTHLHLDHLQGLGFFAPLDNPDYEVHIWGPASPTHSLRKRLTRYLSPPLFPVHLRDMVARVVLHEVLDGTYEVGEFRISAQLVCHPGSTVGYRIENSAGSLAYLPDHEPALGSRPFPLSPAWTSGHKLAQGVDLLIHDAQYTADEYAKRIGWGHSTVEQTLRFAKQARVRRLVPFHHDPAHNDQDLDVIFARAVAAENPPFPVIPAKEGMELHVQE